jgi:hypothetical protein
MHTSIYNQSVGKQLLQLNNSYLEELERKTANTLKQVDLEQAYLKTHVLKQAEFTGLRLYKHVSKTMMLNIGGLYQPLTFYVNGFKSNLSCSVGASPADPEIVVEG